LFEKIKFILWADETLIARVAAQEQPTTSQTLVECSVEIFAEFDLQDRQVVNN